eukprot:gene11632-4873_t
MFGIENLNELICWSKLYFSSNSNTDTHYLSSELEKNHCLLYSPHLNEFPDSLKKSIYILLYFTKLINDIELGQEKLFEEIKNFPIKVMDNGSEYCSKDFKKIEELYLIIDKDHQKFINDAIDQLKDVSKFETNSCVEYNLYCHEKTGPLFLEIIYLIESCFGDDLFDQKLLISFLLFLQKIDQIKNFDEKHLDEFPDEILSKHVKKDELLSQESLLKISNDLIENAMEHIQDSLEFLNRLYLKIGKNRFLFQFFAKSAIHGMSILSMKFDDKNLLRSEVQIQYGLMSRMIVETTSMKEVKLFFHSFAFDIQNKLKNEKRTKEIVQRIINTTGQFRSSNHFCIFGAVVFANLRNMEEKKLKLSNPRILKEILSDKTIRRTSNEETDITKKSSSLDEREYLSRDTTLKLKNPEFSRKYRTLPAFELELEDDEDKQIPQENAETKKSDYFKRRSAKIVCLPGTTLDDPIQAKVSRRDVIEIFLEKIHKDIKKLNEWKNFLTKHFVIEHFLYYKKFQMYKNETNEDEKKKLAKELFEDFINPNGKTPISLSHIAVQKVKKLYENGSEKGFYQVYQQCLITLEKCEYDFLTEVSETSSSSSKDDKKRTITISNTFPELMNNEKEFKIFIGFCRQNLSTNLIECLCDILEYEMSQEEKLYKEIFENYVHIDAPQPFTFNIEIVESATEKYNSNDTDWVHNVKIWLCSTLSFELYPRFLNSKLWKEFKSSQFSNMKSLKFEEKYQILEVEKDLSTIYSTDKILLIQNIITNERLKARKIQTSTSLSKKQSLIYLEKPKHPNLIQLTEIMKEENEAFQETTLYVIANDTPISLDKFIEKLNETDEHLKQSEIYDVMGQIVSAIQYLHENDFFFEPGSLNEFNIYLSETLTECYIDTGFFNDDDEVDVPRYYTENEYGEDKEMGPKEDIFCLGMILVRLITLYFPEKLEELYEIEVDQEKTVKKKERKSTSYFKGIFASLDKTKKYTSNFQTEIMHFGDIYGEDLLNLVMKMVHSNPKLRPDTEDILAHVKLCKKKQFVRASNRVENAWVKITEGWSPEQKSFMFDTLYRQVIKEFLRAEYCVETLLFFEDVLAFKELKRDEKIEKAKEIFYSYLSTRKSPLQVNVNASTLKLISSMMKSQVEIQGIVSDDIFDSALAHVMNTMMSDKYPSFDKTKIYKRFMVTGKIKI